MKQSGAKSSQGYNDNMEFNHERVGTAGWIGLIGYVALWDKIAPETLTHAFKRYDTAVRVGAVAVTAAHLMGVIPRRIDPFYIVADMIGVPGEIDKGPTIDG